MKVERITFNKKSYSRNTNNRKWQLVSNRLDNKSSKNPETIAATKQQNSNRIEESCQQLADETLDGERCFVFITEGKQLKQESKRKKYTSKFDYDKLTIKRWYSEQGLLKKTETITYYTFISKAISVTTYDYEIVPPYPEQRRLIKTETKNKHKPMGLKSTGVITYEYDIDIPLIKEPVLN